MRLAASAGKTTLTEKFLLHGGAVQTAGAVNARGARRRVTSDWMELEQKRGISITSTVLQFPYHGSVLNLLDTPGAIALARRSLATMREAVMASSASCLLAWEQLLAGPTADLVNARR